MVFVCFHYNIHIKYYLFYFAAVNDKVFLTANKLLVLSQTWRPVQRQFVTHRKYFGWRKNKSIIHSISLFSVTRQIACEKSCLLISRTHLSLECDLDKLRPFEDFLSFRLDRSSPFSAGCLSCSWWSSDFLWDFDGFSESLFRACFKKKLSLSGK